MTAFARTSIAKLFRAPWNFEEDYTGKAGSVPVLFTHPFNTTVLPAGTPDTTTALDPEARQDQPPAGVSPVLARFAPVSIGSTACIYLPIVRAYQSINVVEGWGYVWRTIFRMRSTADYTRRKRHRTPFNIGVARFGAADSRAGVVFDRPALAIAGPRTVRPSCLETIIYNRAQPGDDQGEPTFAVGRPDALAIPIATGMVTSTPVYPGAGGGGVGTINVLDYEQGEYDPAVTIGNQPEVAGSTHIRKFEKCVGNEMAVECFKYNLSESGTPYTPRDWDFEFDGNGNVVGGEDWAFSVLLGVGARGQNKSPPVDTGVRVVLGSWPV